MPYNNLDIEEALQVLAKKKNNSPRPFIIRYEIDGEKYIQITTWDKHQKPHHTEKDSIIPPYNPPLKRKDKENGESKSKVKNKSTELDNVSLTVKADTYLFLKDKRFSQTFDDYLEMRKEKKKPATNRAKELVLITLHKHDIDTAIAMLEKSIKNSWTDVYELGNNKLQNQLKETAKFGSKEDE